MEQKRIREILKNVLPPENIKINEEMKKHTTFRIGGPAAIYCTPSNVRELTKTLKICRGEKAPYFILGNGSNLLVSDRGYDGVVIHLGAFMKDVMVKGGVITANAGATLAQAAAAALKNGLTGLEFAAGIPGTVGGACMMNAGAYGGEMKQVLSSVSAISPFGEMVELKADKLDLSYRHSMMMERDYIVLQAAMRLEPGDPDAIRARMEELRIQRLEKQPLEYPSAGSTFKRPEGAFAGKLIMDAGLRGYRVGDAMISEKHCGFVINAGHATAEDVLGVIRHTRKTVKETSGRELEPEIRFLGFDKGFLEEV